MYRDFEVKIHKMGSGLIQTKYIDPKTGKRKRKRFETLKEAKTYKKRMELKIKEKGIHAFSDLRVSEVMKDYLERVSDKQIKARKNHFVGFIEKFGVYKVSEISTSDLQVWMEGIKEKDNLSSLTMNRIKCQFMGFFKFLKSEKLIRENPLSDVHFKSFDTPRRKRIVLSVDEVREILNNVEMFSSDVLFPFLSCLAHTGARRGEILNLLKKDVDFNTKLIHLRNTKNKHERFVRISPALEEVLRKQMDRHSGDFLFADKDGKKLHDKQVAKLMVKFKTFFPLSGKDWGLHSLRHSFAWNFLKKEGKMYQLQAILGHKSIKMTVDLYGQLQAQDIEYTSPYDS